MGQREFNIDRHELDRLLIITIGAACIAALAFAGIMALAIAQPTDQAWVKFTELSINAGAAISTAAAAIVALYFGITGLRRQEAADMAKAELLASRIQFSAQSMLSDLARSVEVLSGPLSSNTKISEVRKLSHRLKEDDRLLMRDELLVGLIPVGHNCPHDIAASIEVLKHVMKQGNELTISRWEELSPDQKEQLAASWLNQLDYSHSCLESAVKSLNAFLLERANALN